MTLLSYLNYVYFIKTNEHTKTITTLPNLCQIASVRTKPNLQKRNFTGEVCFIFSSMLIYCALKLAEKHHVVIVIIIIVIIFIIIVTTT